MAQTKYGQLKMLKFYTKCNNPPQVYQYDYQIDKIVFAETGEDLDISEVVEHLNALNAYCEAVKKNLDNKEILLRRIQNICALIDEHYDREKADAHAF